MIDIRVITEGRIPIKAWTTNIEPGAITQAINLSNLPFAFRQIAIMSDVHQGYGMPIGGILATEEVIIPNAVGVDIGCGVVAIKTDIKSIERAQIEQILSKLKNVIPTGFKHHNQPQDWEGFDKVPDIKIIKQEIKSARQQLATLGSGNHFCSCELGSDGHVWLMVHSGSRNIGLKVANYYNDLAKKVNEKSKVVPKEYNLAVLFLDTNEGQEYYQAMNFCLQFAKANRESIAAKFYRIFAEVTGSRKTKQTIDIHHNYAAREKHFGQNVIVHRKGATSAREGELGIIPGSMGTPSYIVVGLGNQESFMSCSHGAGRLMSRKKVNEVISEEMANQAMEGIVFGEWQGDYSESPLAYKDIEEVMANQLDLVKQLIRLKPLGVMKG